MHTLDGVGAGLIAGGALALILTLTEPSQQMPGLFSSGDSPPERVRRYRNARAGSAVGDASAGCAR